MAPRTMAGIGIGHVPNGTGKCNFYMLHNHQMVTANHFVLLPMTQDVITHLNALASKDRNKVTADAPYITSPHNVPSIQFPGPRHTYYSRCSYATGRGG